MKNLIKKYTFTKQEQAQLRDIEAGIVISNAQLTGLHIFKDAILGSAYKRLGIDGEPRTGFSKSIQYNIGQNEIVYTEEPIKKEENAKK